VEEIRSLYESAGYPLTRALTNAERKTGKNGKGWSTVRYSRIRPRRGSTRFTHLAACVSEEDGSFTVQVRLSDEAEPKSRVWGEEIAEPGFVTVRIAPPDDAKRAATC
jgi:hypothetical protein